VSAISREPRERHRGAGPRAGAGALAQGQRGEQDGEERLGLDHDRGQAGRHPGGDPEELQEELPHEQREADRDQDPPGNARSRQYQGGRDRDEEAKRGELRRREVVERPSGRDEGEAPDDHHEEHEGEMDGRHAARP